MLFLSFRLSPMPLLDSWDQLSSPCCPFPWLPTLRRVSVDGHAGLQPSWRLGCPAQNLGVQELGSYPGSAQ